MSNHIEEDYRINQLRNGVIRKISPKRARKLRKRGEYVWFCFVLDSNVWEP